MSNGGIAASTSSAYIGEVRKAAHMSLSVLFCILIRGLICVFVPVGPCWCGVVDDRLDCLCV
jgi:hypothetical protein